MKVSKIATAISTLVSSLAILALTVGPQKSWATEPKPRYGGMLTISDLADEPNIGYPPKMVKPLSIRLGAPAIETLLRNDQTGELVPWLATGYEQNAKAMTITLALRKGVKFHDGTNFNAEAVKWNLEQSISAKSSAAEKISSVVAVDDSTVRIKLSGWDSTVVSNFSQALGMMISPTAYKKNGEEWCLLNPVGTGPFQFVNRQQKTQTTFRKFADYWKKGRPYLDGIVYLHIQDSLTRELSLKRGEIDVMETFAAKDLAALEKDGLVVIRRPTPAGAKCLVPDSANPNSPFSNLKVRQAAQYAVDTNAINKAIFFGENEPANQQVYKGHWAYNPSVVGYPYNPAKAKQLLAEAGYPNGFKTKITYYTTPEYDQLMGAVQGYLKRIGIEAELDPAQLGRFNQVMTGAKWDGLYFGQSSGNPDVLILLDQFYSGTGKAYTQLLVPPDYGKAIQQAIAAPDFKTKQKWIHETMKLMSDKHSMFLLLLCISEFSVSQPYVHSHGLLQSANTMQWTPEDAWRER